MKVYPRICFWKSPRRPLPAIELVTEFAFLNGSFVFPNPWHVATGAIPGCPLPICSVRFGVSPLHDRIYVDGLQVKPEYQRRGFATSLLLALATQASPTGAPLPITALRETRAAGGFWDKLRQRKIHGLAVTGDVRDSEMSDEAKRWTEIAPSVQGQDA